nr:hypothetical protein [Deltaproteobacteria bacterium]
MGSRYASLREGAGERLGVEAIVLASVLPDADLPHARGVDEQGLVAERDQPIVDVPRLAAGLERDPCGRCVGAEEVVELVEGSSGLAMHDVPVAHLTQHDLSDAEVESYGPHG